MLRCIKAAEEDVLSREDMLNEAMKNLDSNFEYVLDGISKLIDDGEEDVAQEVLDSLQDAVTNAEVAIASAIAKNAQGEV